MKLVESSDGSIRVIELDPTKHHIFVFENLDAIQRDRLHDLRIQDGTILIKAPNVGLSIVETDDAGGITAKADL